MARVSVDIPDSVLTEEKAKELSAARKRIKALETKVRDLEKTHQKAKACVQEYRAFRSTVAESLDLFEDYPWD